MAQGVACIPGLSGHRAGPLTTTSPIIANHATATFAFDAGLLYVLNDASDIAQLDALNALVALLARLAAALIEPRWYVPYNESLILC